VRTAIVSFTEFVDSGLRKRFSTRHRIWICVFIASAALHPALYAQSASLKGIVTDPSGAFVPGATVTIAGPDAQQHRAQTDSRGAYLFQAVSPGAYSVRVEAKGFQAFQQQNLEINGAVTLNASLAIAAEAQVVNVEDHVNSVSVDPGSNGGALVLGQKELESLSDDPDELSNELQAMAGPGAGPNGGEIYIDGFTGGQLPPKSSIREIRINSNPFSPEYDRPGFGRIEIFTKPGTDKIHGQAFFQFNNQDFNSRSPLLDSSLPPYKQQFFGVNLSGPIIKDKASFSFNFERRAIDENAFVLATTLDSNLNPQTVNQAIVTPQWRTTFSPRIDYTLNAMNTLTVRYQDTRIEQDGQGVGSFSLPSQAYTQKDAEKTIQATETDILSPQAINETRFQFMKTNLNDLANNSMPAINVAGAFVDGGAQIGNSGTVDNRWELTNTSTYTHLTHTFKWGGRVRQDFLTDTSVNDFGGTYTFLGGVGPELDASNQAIAGTSEQLTALQVYQRTLLFQQLGYAAAEIRALGGGATQFSIGAGTPTTRVNQLDLGLFFNDDWRLRPNLTLSYGLRYETQTNIHDYGDLAPRIALAWGIGGGAGKQTKTVLRAGFGTFYDRIADTVTLSALRFNGSTQQSYLVLNPDFYPTIPSLTSLAASRQPQQLQYIYGDIKAPRIYQAVVSLERQVNRYFRVTGQYMFSRGDHLSLTRDINAPVNGIYPYGDSAVRLLAESTGMSRSNQLFISPNFNYKKIFLFGFYALSYGMDNNEGQPADPYNLRAEWGPSTFADVRHRLVMGTNLPLPWKVSVSPFVMFNSGTPYDITIGRDLNGDSFAAERPSLLSIPAAQCTGSNLLYANGYGCFDLNPAAGTSISRNYGRGPSSFFLNMRLARTWSFGNRKETSDNNMQQQGPPPGMGGVRGGGGPPPGGGPGGGGPPPGGGPGGPGGMFGGSGAKKYNLTLSVMARNILNHPNYAAPSGDLLSPYFGEYRSLAGFGPFGASTTYNRKIDLQLRFTF